MLFGFGAKEMSDLSHVFIPNKSAHSLRVSAWHFAADSKPVVSIFPLLGVNSANPSASIKQVARRAGYRKADGKLVRCLFTLLQPSEMALPSLRCIARPDPNLHHWAKQSCLILRPL